MNGGGNGGAAEHAAAGPDAALSGLALANLPFVEELYFQFLSDPASVDPTWRRYFQSLNGNGAGNGDGRVGAGAARGVPAQHLRGRRRARPVAAPASRAAASRSGCCPSASSAWSRPTASSGT